MAAVLDRCLLRLLMRRRLCRDLSFFFSKASLGFTAEWAPRLRREEQNRQHNTTQSNNANKATKQQQQNTHKTHTKHNNTHPHTHTHTSDAPHATTDTCVTHAARTHTHTSSGVYPWVSIAEEARCDVARAGGGWKHDARVSFCDTDLHTQAGWGDKHTHAAW